MTFNGRSSRVCMAAAPPSIPTAGQRVFATAELLEMILLEEVASPHTDGAQGLRTVLCSQRINHDFRSAVQGSQALKRALYLSYDESYFNDNIIVPEVNLLLLWSTSLARAIENRVPFNFHFVESSAARAGMGSLNFVAKKHALQEAAEGSESWKQMLLVQSICSTFNVNMLVVGFPHTIVNFDVRSDVTVGELLEEGRKVLQAKWPRILAS